MTFDQDYRSYLLRLWRVRDDGERWRAALERVENGERRGFTSLEALFEYLLQVTQARAGPQERRTNGEQRQGEP